MEIRDQQIRAMVDHNQVQSEQSFVDYCRATIPGQVTAYDDEALRSLIRSSIERGRAYGILGGRALILFVTLAIVIAPNFDDDPPTHQFLRLPGIDPDTKLEMLTTMVSERLRALP